MTTQSEKVCWLKQVKSSTVENELEGSSKGENEPEKSPKVEEGLEKKSAALLARFPTVMQAIEANNSNPEDLKDILQTWCFDSNAQDPMTVIYALLLNIPKVRDALLPMHPVMLKVREDSAHNDVGELLELRVGHSVIELFDMLHLDKNPLVTGIDDDVISLSPVRMSLLPLSDAQMRSFNVHLEQILGASDDSSWYIWLLLIKVLDLIDFDQELPKDYQWY
jgi:hypothetical protein